MGLSRRTAASPASPRLTRNVVLRLSVRSLLACRAARVPCRGRGAGGEARVVHPPAPPPLVPPGILGMGEGTVRPRRAGADGTWTLGFVHGLPPAPHTTSAVGAWHSQHQGLLRGPKVTAARGAPLEAGSEPGATRARHQPPVTVSSPHFDPGTGRDITGLSCLSLNPQYFHRMNQAVSFPIPMNPG